MEHRRRRPRRVPAMVAPARHDSALGARELALAREHCAAHCWRTKYMGSREPYDAGGQPGRSEEHTSELQSLMRISYAVFCLKKKKKHTHRHIHNYLILNQMTNSTE